MPTLESYDIRIARDGTWFHNGSPIGRKQLVRLFSTVLSRDEEGRYWLRTPAEYGQIEVEDVPFIAQELAVEGEGRERILRFRTNVDDWVAVDAEHPLWLVEDAAGNPTPYVRVRGRLDARLDRPVYYHLIDLAEPRLTAADADDTDLGVWSSGTFFPLTPQ